MVDAAQDGTALGLARGRPDFGFPAILPPIRRFLLGLFLIAAFAATGAVLLLVVTAEQLQTAVATPDFAALKISTGWIRQDVAYLERYWEATDAVARLEKASEDALFKVRAREGANRAAMSGAADETRGFIDLNDTIYILPPLKFHPLANEDATDGAAAAGDAPPPAWGFAKRVDDYFVAYYAELDAAPGSPEAASARKSLNAFKTETYRRMTKYFAARAQYESDASAAATLNTQLAALEKQAKALDAEAQAEGTPLANDAYWSLAEDFRAFKRLAGDFAYNIVALPRMMLVLLLSIFMGILGSLIYITMDFYRDPDGRGFWNIVFRIGLGAGVAFALFFFAAAGMLALAQTKSGVQSDMSPYLISFLGITGGYLSDRVTQWMREVGENTFKIKSDGPPDRWAIDLGAKLQAAGLDGAALADAAGATTADAQAWIARTKPVPGAKQGLVAAFLRLHPSGVFTDIPPG